MAPVGSGFLGIAITLYVDAIISGTLNRSAEELVHYGVPISLILSVLSFVIGGIELYRKGSLLDKIRSKSKVE